MTKIKKRHDFIESGENPYIEKSVIYKNKLPYYKDELGLADELIAEDTAFVDSILTKKEAKDLAVSDASAKVEDFTQTRSSFTAHMRNRRTEIMSLPNYTKSIGIDLGLETSFTNVDTQTLVPEAKIYMEGGYPMIKFKKLGTDGIRIYSRVNGQGEFNFLDVCNGTKYIDVRPKANSLEPELREYTFFYIIKGEKVGQESKVYKFSL